MAIATVNLGGLTRTVAVTKVLLVASLAALAAVVVAGRSSPDADLGRLTPLDGSPGDILGSAGFLFFSFAGYARIATLGEEVRDPETTIPEAIPRALGGVLAIYAIVGVTMLAVVPVTVLADSRACAELVVDAGRFDGLSTVTRLGAGFDGDLHVLVRAEQHRRQQFAGRHRNASHDARHDGVAIDGFGDRLAHAFVAVRILPPGVGDARHRLVDIVEMQVMTRFERPSTTLKAGLDLTRARSWIGMFSIRSTSPASSAATRGPALVMGRKMARCQTGFSPQKPSLRSRMMRSPLV